MNLPLVIPAIIIAIYAFVGIKINQNALKWGVIGLLVMVSVLLVSLPIIILVHDVKIGAIIWQYAYLVSWIVALLLIYFIYKRNNSRLFDHKIHH